MARDKKLKAKRQITYEDEEGATAENTIASSSATTNSLEKLTSNNTNSSHEHKRKRFRSIHCHKPAIDALVINENKKNNNSDNDEPTDSEPIKSPIYKSVPSKESKLESSKAAALKTALEEIAALKKEISRLNAEVAFKDQVIESLQAESKKLKPGLTCVICVEFMSNPCTISCGHTFCYECLRDWLKIRRECPTCRMKITQRPALSFVVKEQVETYIERLPPDEKHIAKQRLKTKEEIFNSLEDAWENIIIEQAPVILDASDDVVPDAHGKAIVGSRCSNCGSQYLVYEGGENDSEGEIMADDARDNWDYDLDDPFIDRRTTDEILSDDSYTSESQNDAVDDVDDIIDNQQQVFEEHDSESTHSTHSSESTRSNGSEVMRRGNIFNILMNNTSFAVTMSSNSELPTRRFTQMSISPVRVSRESDNDSTDPSPLPIQRRRNVRLTIQSSDDDEDEDNEEEINSTRSYDPSSGLSWLRQTRNSTFGATSILTSSQTVSQSSRPRTVIEKILKQAAFDEQLVADLL
ncbi:1031_t:CDS:2 [Ambispora leptoticha]|uniref:1031_t:CDS:1 n=1 Tax=Ambispora leptoticha TaxID=144679 RepID=A0A9N8VQL1_9GLOM|nr:1031_t:CDS:2 [Ambispora leptoticha]